MNCLNCGHLERHHGDPNLPAGYNQVCDDYEPDHEAQAELAEWYADIARDREMDSRLERERERNCDVIHDWERYMDPNEPGPWLPKKGE